MKLTYTDLVGMMDHSLLSAHATLDELAHFAATCRKYRFKSACINSGHTAEMVSRLEGSGVLVGVTVGFPLGACATDVKVAEAALARQHGANEVDMVINVGLLKSGEHHKTHQDIAAVVNAVEGLTVKVILENCYLTDDEKRTGCRISAQAGAAFAKTSTGFGTGGATVEDVLLMRGALAATDVQIKAAGGIRTVETALDMIRAGATRLGVSAGHTIADEFKRLYPHGCDVPSTCPGG